MVLFTSLFSKVDIDLSHDKVKNGTTLAVILQSTHKLKQAPNIIYKNKTFQMFTINGSTKKYELFLPIDYYTKLQKTHLQVKYIDNKIVKRKNIYFNVIDGKYKQNEIIKVAKGKVVLNKKNKKRSNIEYAKVYKHVYSVIDTKNYIPKSKFILPMNSKITSAYGTARVYNNITKTYHTGVDFRAKVGAEIYASNDGIVSLTMKRFYLGNVIYINHGRGSYSYYSHLSKFLVKDKQVVKKGNVIAYSGKTGRITGPHLHYAFRLYNTTVDPIQYGNLYNKIINKYH